jgi:hypothetical protein
VHFVPHFVAVKVCEATKNTLFQEKKVIKANLIAKYKNQFEISNVFLERMLLCRIYEITLLSFTPENMRRN